MISERFGTGFWIQVLNLTFDFPVTVAGDGRPLCLLAGKFDEAAGV
jgi:hypothetical protein